MTLYVLTLSKMMTTDNFDVVPAWSAVVAEKDLSRLSLSDAAALLSIHDLQVEELRDMTEAEVAEWRKNT